MKEAILNGLHTAWFHLHEILKKIELVWPGPVIEGWGGKTVYYKGAVQWHESLEHPDHGDGPGVEDTS